MDLGIEMNNTVPQAAPPYVLRWSGIFAGLVVGIATNLLLLLLGGAVGLSMFDVGQDSAQSVTTAAAIGNAICMIVAAFVGAYVAARTAGMRRTPDGVLHGVVSWGFT